MKMFKSLLMLIFSLSVAKVAADLVLIDVSLPSPVNIPSLMADCKTNLDRDLVAEPYKKLASNGQLYTYGGQDYYYPEYLNVKDGLTSTGYLKLSTQGYTNSKQFDMDSGMTNVACFTVDGRIKIATLKYDANTGFTSTQYAEQLQSNSFEFGVYRANKVDANGDVTQGSIFGILQPQTMSNDKHYIYSLPLDQAVQAMLPFYQQESRRI